MKTILSLALFGTAIVLFFLVDSYAEGKKEAFPIYGSGAIQVRIYTDFFCSPCRGMKPAVEPVLRDIVKRNIITLTMVDTPF